MTRRHVLSFLTDVNVPDSVGIFLVNVGHDVARVREIMAADAPDPIVAEAAMHAGRILISWDKDFNHQRFMQPRFANLSRIGFCCPEPEGAQRLGAVIDLVEFAVGRSNGSPVTIRIARNKFQVTC